MTQEQADALIEAAELLRTAARRVHRAGYMDPQPKPNVSFRIGVIAGAAVRLATSLEECLKDDTEPPAGKVMP